MKIQTGRSAVFSDFPKSRCAVKHCEAFFVLQRKVVVFVRARNDPHPRPLPNKRGGEKKKKVV
jgi:hypothetical protein